MNRHGFDHWPGVSLDMQFGEKHVLTGVMPCPDGSTLDVPSGWMLSADGATAEFVRAYPAP